MPAISVRAPAKTILFGEHAVVYGIPGIAVPIDTIGIKIGVFAKPKSSLDSISIYHVETASRYFLESLSPTHPTRAAIEIIKDSLEIDHVPTCEIQIASSIPNSAGLGSSAAFAVALVKAISLFLGFELDNNKINEIAYKIEKIQHGSPSGIDNTVITYERPVYFHKQGEQEFLPIKTNFKLIIADSGQRTPTKQVVAEIKELYSRDKKKIEELFEEIHIIVMKAKQHLINTDIKALGKLMNDNHKSLMRLGVSCEILDHLAQSALHAGAYGAKMCGGGRGGIIAALTPDELSEHVIESLKNAGAIQCFKATIQAHK